MSALQPSTFESHTPLAEAGTPARDRGPYAQPSPHQQAGKVDAMLIDAIRANRGPYVPAPWRIMTDDPASRGPAVLPSSAHADEARLHVISADAHVPSQGSAMVPTPLTAMAPASDVESVVESVPTELPWIDAFMDTSENGDSSDATESVEMVAAPEAILEVAAEVTSEVAMEVNVDAAMELAAEATGEVVSEQASTLMLDAVADSTTDSAPETNAEAEWPLSEAGDAMRALADDLVAREATARDVMASDEEIAASFEVTSESAEIRADAEPPFAQTQTQPLPMWGDEDLMNIMPVSPTPETGMPGHWAGAHPAEAPASSARAESTGGQAEHGNREAVALVLEALAQRTRNGELPIPGNATEMGDAAVLAATLATLLGARR